MWVIIFIIKLFFLVFFNSYKIIIFKVNLINYLLIITILEVTTKPLVGSYFPPIMLH
jgi:hypothetical protein